LNYKQNQQKWIDSTLTMLTEGVQAAGDLKPREVSASNPFPDRGLGLTTTGGARLAVSVIGLRNGKQDGVPVVDSFTLSKEELATTVPASGKTDCTLPESAAKKFAVALAPITDSIYVPQSKDVSSAEVTGKVLREVDGIMVIRWSGKWESKHFRDGHEKYPILASATGEGIGLFDTAKKELTTLLFVLKGTYTNGTVVTPTSTVIDWQAVRKE
jgi:hypothetical protein